MRINDEDPTQRLYPPKPLPKAARDFLSERQDTELDSTLHQRIVDRLRSATHEIDPFEGMIIDVELIDL